MFNFLTDVSVVAGEGAASQSINMIQPKVLVVYDSGTYFFILK